jgi:hypothetical protein
VVVPSGIVLPGDEPLTVKEVIKGLYVVVNAYERDAGYFARSPLYPMEPPQSASEPASEEAPTAVASNGE